MRFLAQTISWVLMPILMPIYALILVEFIPSEPIDLAAGDSLYLMPLQNKIVLIIYYFMFSVVAPGLLYLLLKNMKVITTLEMDDKRERRIPLVIMSISCLFLFYLLSSNQLHLPKYMYGLCLSGAVIISIFTIVNNYFKVSLHATGVGIFTGFLLAYFSEQLFFNIWILALGFIVSGIVLSSRIFLEKHTPKELLVGYVFSFLITFALNLFYPFGN